MNRKILAALSTSTLLVATLAIASTAGAIGIGCNSSEIQRGGTTTYTENCTATVNEGGYIVCLGYSAQRVTGGDDPSTSTQCSNGVRPTSAGPADPQELLP